MPVGVVIATVQFGKSVPFPNRLKFQVITDSGDNF